MSSSIGTRVALPASAGVAAAFAYCELLARSHYENFPVGSLLIPKSNRRYVYAIYAFARIADDYADEHYDQGISIAQRLDALEGWGLQLDKCLYGEASHPVFLALGTTIRDLRLPIELLHDLLSAFRQDVVKRRYADFNEVTDYCRRSANPIGRLILLLFGYRDSTFDRLSDSICTALQLTNFWQDVGVDIDKDRIYLPIDEMEGYGITEDDIRMRHFSTSYAALLSSQVSRTRVMFAEGRPLCEMVRGRLRYELRLTWLGGMRILERIEACGFDTLSRRPSIRTRDKIALIAKTLLKRH